tara:strand:- start:3853 stop:4701 length:849 start_codon:yes stop_codon:yes gene_type:complete
MILVDLNQVLISNLMAQTRGKAEEMPNKDMIRHMVINSIRGYKLKFGEQYGDIILCADASNTWRRSIFPNYKYARKKNREDSATNWLSIFEVINDIRVEIQENFPYMVLHIDTAEADDIIGTLVKELAPKEKNILIISGDKDFIQLQKYANVKQYAPIQKKFIEDANPKRFLHEQIIKGDRSDGVPNILSNDDVFVVGEKQRPINKKRLEEWANVDNIPLGSETKKFYQRNKTLIDLEQIPEPLVNTIINRYTSYKVNNRSKLLPYFMKHKLKALMTNINDF